MKKLAVLLAALGVIAAPAAAAGPIQRYLSKQKVVVGFYTEGGKLRGVRDETIDVWMSKTLPAGQTAPVRSDSRSWLGIAMLQLNLHRSSSARPCVVLSRRS